MSMLLSSKSLATAASAQYRRLVVVRSDELKAGSLGDRMERLRACNSLESFAKVSCFDSYRCDRVDGGSSFGYNMIVEPCQTEV